MTGIRMVLTEEEALLRVAILVAHADGDADIQETARAVAGLPHLFKDLSDRRLQELLADAAKDITQNAADEVMDRVLESLPGHAGRVSALQVACTVAGANRMLSWQENAYLVGFAGRLGLSPRDIGQVVRAAR